MSDILLLTATIAPPANVPGLNRLDPVTRLGDYCRALDFYCTIPTDYVKKTVFIENSDSDLSELRQVVARHRAADRFEFLGFDGLDHPAKYGRGYGEFKLLDYAMEHSNTLREAAPSQRLWKATGRYRVLNLVELIRSAPAQYELYCDLRERPIPWIDLRVFSCTLGGYRQLLMGRYHDMREDQIHMSPERYLQPVMAKLAKSHAIVTSFAREPFIDGVRGKDSKNYASGVNRLKYWARALGRRLRR